MRNILVIGSGKSSSYLIKYLLTKSETENLHITIGDINIGNAQKLVGQHPNANAVTLDVFNSKSRKDAITKADIVISMLPARFPRGDHLVFEKRLSDHGRGYQGAF